MKILKNKEYYNLLLENQLNKNRIRLIKEILNNNYIIIFAKNNAFKDVELKEILQKNKNIETVKIPFIKKDQQIIYIEFEPHIISENFVLEYKVTSSAIQKNEIEDLFYPKLIKVLSKTKTIEFILKE